MPITREVHDVTELLSNFREAARHLWNTTFVRIPTERSIFEVQEDYAECELALFKSLVLGPLGRENCDLPAPCFGIVAPLPFLHVVPRIAPLPIMINREIPASGYWDHRVQAVEGDITLHLIGYADWDWFGQRDFEFYVVRIASSTVPAYQELIGRDARLAVDEHLMIQYDPEAPNPEIPVAPPMCLRPTSPT